MGAICQVGATTFHKEHTIHFPMDESGDDFHGLVSLPMRIPADCTPSRLVICQFPAPFRRLW
jgi:hypothetical protein